MAYIPPEERHRAGIRKAVALLAKDIQKECGASRVIIDVRYDINRGVENVYINMKVSKDSQMERADANPPKPTGDNLANKAEQGVRKLLRRKPKGV